MVLDYSSMSLSKLHLAFLGLVDGILWQVYFTTNPKNIFLNTGYKLIPFMHIISIFGYFLANLLYHLVFHFVYQNQGCLYACISKICPKSNIVT